MRSLVINLLTVSVLTSAQLGLAVDPVVVVYSDPSLTRLEKEIGVTPAQSEALRIIADHGPLALGELGDMLVCDSGASPSRIVGSPTRLGH